VEALVILGVFVLIFAAYVPSLLDQYSRFQLEANASDLVHALRLAQSRSMMSETDDTFGMHLVPGPAGSFTLFKGDSFALRDASYDEVHALPANLSLSETVAGSDILFARIEGTTAGTGTVTVSLPAAGLSRTVGINAAGTIDPQ
jgi:hypothetical protein